MSDAVVVEARCDVCGATRATKATARGDARLPGGWKRHAGRVWCDRCWAAAYVLRAVTIPVAGPVDGAWEELREVLAMCWRASTTVANWAVRELLQADIVRTPDLERLPAAPRPYLYPGARTVAPEMDSQSLTSLLRAVERRYVARRLAVVWQRREAPPSYRYPTPYPVHNRAWGVERQPGGGWILSVRLGGERRRLRLRGGVAFRRQAAALAQLERGEALAGELSLYERGSAAAQHRAGTASGRVLMAKLVLWLPRREVSRAEPKAGTVVVRTAVDALLRWGMDGDEESDAYFADHARRWASEAARRQERLKNDIRGRRQRAAVAERRAAWSAKQRRRMDSLTHEVSARVVRYIARAGASEVVLDLTDRGYVESFPWAELRGKLGYKLAELGVTVRDASGAVVSEAAGSLEAAV